MSADPTMSLDRDIQLATGVTSAVVVLFARVIQELDAAGIASKKRFADRLEREAQEAHEDRAPELGTTDLIVFRQLAKALRAPQAPEGAVWDAAKWGA